MKRPFGSPVLDAAARLLAPYILVFALYVIFHGHDSPGGGFQGGTILAAAVILIQLVRGEEVRWRVSRPQCVLLACAGVGLYAAIGIAAVLAGGAFLDYGVLPFPVHGAEVRAMGTLLVEVGIAGGVMGVMILIFDLLATPEES